MSGPQRPPEPGGRFVPPAVPGGIPDDLDTSALALRAGLVVAVPTDTVYGLAADPTVAGATARLFTVKGRPDAVALPVLVPGTEAAEELVGTLDGVARRLADRYWPGPLTMVLPRSTSPAAATAATVLELGGDPATIGLRCPAHPVLLALLHRAGSLAVTSANPHGKPPLTDAAAVRATFGDAVAAVLDGGTCAGTPSTVVRVTVDGLELLRAGAVEFGELLAAAAA